jgi:hypothetical protein
MARIRTIKPDFFRHELLQHLEVAHPDARPMLVFCGLFGHCDKQGVFQWRPNHLKLDIMPFVPFEIAKTLEILEKHDLIVGFKVSGEHYGWIPTFNVHQRIGGNESQSPARFPCPPSNLVAKMGKRRGTAVEAPRKHKGSDKDNPQPNAEAIGIAGREGKGKERKGTGAEAQACGQLKAGESKAGDKYPLKGNGKSANEWALELGIQRVSGEHEGSFQARVLAAVEKHKAAQA